jgi:hypothetical protein
VRDLCSSRCFPRQAERHLFSVLSPKNQGNGQTQDTNSLDHPWNGSPEINEKGRKRAFLFFRQRISSVFTQPFLQLTGIQTGLGISPKFRQNFGDRGTRGSSGIRPCPTPRLIRLEDVINGPVFND